MNKCNVCPTSGGTAGTTREEVPGVDPGCSSTGKGKAREGHAKHYGADWRRRGGEDQKSGSTPGKRHGNDKAQWRKRGGENRKPGAPPGMSAPRVVPIDKKGKGPRKPSGYKPTGRQTGQVALNASVMDMAARTAGLEDALRDMRVDAEEMAQERLRLASEQKKMEEEAAKLALEAEVERIRQSRRMLFHSWECSYRDNDVDCNHLFFWACWLGYVLYLIFCSRWVSILFLGMEVPAFFSMLRTFLYVAWYWHLLLIPVSVLGDMWIAVRKGRVWLGCTGLNHYRFLNWVDSSAADMRQDTISMGQLKHIDPMLFKVGYSWSFLGVTWEYSETIASFELLTQLTAHRNLEVDSDDKVAYDRIKWTSMTMNSVNLDRDLSIFPDGAVPAQTCLLGYALFCQARCRVKGFPRPSLH